MRFTVLAISADEPWLNRQTVDIYPRFAEFEINHGFHPDQYPDQSCQSLISDNVYGNPNGQTSTVLHMIAMAARWVNHHRRPSDRVARLLSDMQSLPQRMALSLRKKMEEIKDQQYLEVQIIYETGRLMRDLEVGDV